MLFKKTYFSFRRSIFGALILLAGLMIAQYTFVFAQIENALTVQSTDINLGVALPGQAKVDSILVSLSEAALQSTDIGTINYKITQKQKCKVFGEDGSCIQYYPTLCPYLAEIPQVVSSPEAPEDENLIPTPHEAG